jgi:DNA-nicking Smr family endonuclease
MGKKRRRLPANHNPGDAADTSEESLFREAMAGVEPLPEQNRITPVLSNRTALTPRSKCPAPNNCTGKEAAPQPLMEQWLRAGQSPAVTKSLRGDNCRVDGSLDLHHLKADDARRQLRRFLDQADRDHCHRLRIIHGRGLHSTGRAVLPELVQDELRLDPRVIAFRLAGRFDGGAGAVRVLFNPDSR